MNSRMRRRTTERLAAYLEGEVTASERLAIDKDLAEDAEQRKYLAQLLQIRSAVASPVAELEDLDLVARVRQGAKSPPLPKKVEFGRWVWAASSAAVAAGLASYVGVTSNSDSTAAPEFQTRAVETPTHARWTGVQVYRVDASNSQALPLGQIINPRDGLLFSYTNSGTQPFSHLAVFGVDDAGQVFWYHPAYLDAQTDPESIPIRAGVTQEPLNAVVRHVYTGESLRLYAMFSHRPWRVSELEAWVKQAGSGEAAPSPIPHDVFGKSERKPEPALEGTWIQHLNVEVSRKVP